ncbi:MAG: hypothetical protein WD423_07250 [Rhodothermales bacterium]
MKPISGLVPSTSIAYHLGQWRDVPSDVWEDSPSYAKRVLRECDAETKINGRIVGLRNLSNEARRIEGLAVEARRDWKNSASEDVRRIAHKNAIVLEARARIIRRFVARRSLGDHSLNVNEDAIAGASEPSYSDLFDKSRTELEEVWSDRHARPRLIYEMRFSFGTEWREQFDAIVEEAKRFGLEKPYKNHKSMKSAMHRFAERNDV